MSQLNATIVNLLLTSRPDIKLVYLFGSYATNTQTKNSDIDIAVLAAKPISSVERWQLSQELAASLNKDVDLVDLKACSDVLKMQIVKNGICLYSAGSANTLFIMQSISRYQHLNNERASLLEQYASINELK